MFRGINPINLDTKGRFAMPTRYRDRIAEICDSQLIATIDTQDRCLLIYPLPEWEKIEAKLMELPAYDAAARRIQRLLLGHATELEIDSAGRVLLSQPLREHALLDKRLVLIGQGKRFELWSEEVWNGQRDAYLEEASKDVGMSDQIKSLVL
ncbi:MAG: division/cell wall cluster transcriptional repressor MraZ [Hahellaceae bacterium]|nr:division/cell wall cluster transcriptional repressor MraZ [Hahellaceae bacterium]